MLEHMRSYSAKYLLLLLLAMQLLYQAGASVYANEDYSSARMQMVNEIRDMVRETRSYIGKDSLNERVIQAMARVPRHEFVPDAMRSYAYENRALPIGEEQTISQPYIVALMTDLADINKNSSVLEVGTGSGYQAAVLAELAGHVYTIEIIDSLGKRARATLERLNYQNVTVRIGDGYHGWQEHAPFDAILVTAAPEQVPQPLIEQLKPGGKLVIPVGRPFGGQSLQVLEKNAAGEVVIKDVLPVGFVPLTGDHAN